MNTHSCIKCTEEYQDEDTEAYYCPKCLTEHKANAKAIDARLAHIPRTESMSDLQAYDQAQKVHGFLQVRL